MDAQQVEVEREETGSNGVYVITRGFREGKQLSTAQKTSALFAEEPVVLGRVLRRGSKPMRISGADYRANEGKLLALEKAGAIKIQRPQEEVMKPCSMCGQVPRGQGGEYKCPKCGLPLVHDPATLNQGAGDAPASQEPAAPKVEVAAPATPEVIVPPHPPSTEEAPVPPPVEEPVPAPAPDPVPAADEVPAPPPSAPKADSKSSSKKKASSK